jgi:hypothetical protein
MKVLSFARAVGLSLPLIAVSAQGQIEAVQSPLSSPTTPQPTAEGQPEYEVTGIVKNPQYTLVGVAGKHDGRSFWIRVGESAGGIDVLSHDKTTDRVQIRVAGAVQTIGLRAQSFGALLPDFSTLGTVPLAVAAKTPAAAVQAQEREARMMVSDLLDLGVQQRRTYLQAQPKTAPDNSAKTAK